MRENWWRENWLILYDYILYYMTNAFEEKYFVGASGSNYLDYRTKRFSNLADDIIKILSLDKDCKIIDFGCATGALLNELKNRGFKNIKGTDISNWAIEYGRKIYDLEDELEFYNRNLLYEGSDYIIMLDVLEHLPDYELETILKLARKGLNKGLELNKGLLVRIPVSHQEGEDFVLEVSKNDRTHIQIHSRNWWISMIESFGFKFIIDIYENSIYSSNGVLCGVFK